MTQKGKTPGQIADELDVTRATIRNYVSRFGEFLSPEAQRKTRKRFSPEDVNTLRYAKSQLDQGMTYDQVIDELETYQPLVGEVIDEEIPAADPEHEIPPESTDEIPSSIQTLEFFTAVIDQLNAEHKTALEAKDALIDELKQDKERLQRKLDRSFWDRLFGRG